MVATVEEERRRRSGTCWPRTRATASRKKKNQDFQFYATVAFMQTYLLN